MVKNEATDSTKEKNAKTNRNSPKVTSHEYEHRRYRKGNRINKRQDRANIVGVT